ncbi:benzoate-CoA ligase family protein [Actinomycetospora endophytica]|uniref:Benzoate-CoA ligase family protein n=1 Tax=Actinomycetospora endophytica TaxID=2291215 RepID=A0ABS8PCP7_9PSEU|nr:benzoate-CoA ligase family protein [Actinomycetospora endophytica]MCD2196032.1 benzoate-CoA ligase family protein [Actinomycetospora endophytica]
MLSHHQQFNASHYLVDRHLGAPATAGRPAVRAIVPDAVRELDYETLAREVGSVAAGLRAIGVRPEQRVLMCCSDGIELFTAILAAMRIGAVAVPVSTMLRGPELAKLVIDSRAPVLLCSPEFGEVTRTAVALATEDRPDLFDVVVTPANVPVTDPDPLAGFAVRTRSWADLLAAGEGGDSSLYPTWDESPALWLYTSGTTGTPKAAMHRHADIRTVCETYGAQVLGIRPDDVCFSVAKLFFAYGIGNSMFFPLSVGASSVLAPGRPSPAAIAEIVTTHPVTLFYGSPSVYGPLLASDLPDETFRNVRQGVSAGEALPARMVIGMRDRFGVEVLDGIGSTEALHIYLSNKPGEVAPGTSGVPVPGYEVEIRDDDGSIVPEGTKGTLYLRADSLCTGYWCRTDVNRLVFEGEWMRTGDTYIRNPDGTYQCLGRTDDVLKVGGIWVTPMEVEERLVAHPSVAEVVVVGVPDDDGLDRTVACVIPAEGAVVDEDALIAWCREGLASFKKPSHVLTIDAVPRTATGKVQRFLVRELAAARLAKVPAGM